MQVIYIKDKHIIIYQVILYIIFFYITAQALFEDLHWKTYKMAVANSKGTDQHVHLCSLIIAFTVGLYNKWTVYKLYSQCQMPWSDCRLGLRCYNMPWCTFSLAGIHLYTCNIHKTFLNRWSYSIAHFK